MSDRLIWRLDNDDPVVQVFIASAREMTPRGGGGVGVGRRPGR